MKLLELTLELIQRHVDLKLKWQVTALCISQADEHWCPGDLTSSTVPVIPLSGFKRFMVWQGAAKEASRRADAAAEERSKRKQRGPQDMNLLDAAHRLQGKPRNVRTEREPVEAPAAHQAAIFELREENFADNEATDEVVEELLAELERPPLDAFECPVPEPLAVAQLDPQPEAPAAVPDPPPRRERQGGVRGVVDKNEFRLPSGGLLRYYPAQKTLYAVCDHPDHDDCRHSRTCEATKVKNAKRGTKAFGHGAASWKARKLASTVPRLRHTAQSQS